MLYFNITGYYSRPWQWDLIKNNVGLFGILQLHSRDDPYIPMSEADFVAQQLDSEYHVFEDREHFFYTQDSPVIFDVVVKKMQSLNI